MASITKQQLSQLGPHYGKLDQDSGLVFVGFAGRLHLEDGRYHGELRTREPIGDELETLEQFDLQQIINLKGLPGGDSHETLDGGDK